MSAPTYTPGPWEVVAAAADARPGTEHLQRIVHRYTVGNNTIVEDIAENVEWADAHHIAKCVNTHAQLVEALREIYTLRDKFFVNLDAAVLHEIADTARAALKAAGVEV